MKTSLRFTLSLFVVLALSACSTKTLIPTSEREAVRQQVEQQASKGIERLVELNPELKEEVEQAAGYFAIELSSFKVPVLGKSNGLGALYNKYNDSITYMDVERYDVGFGLGKSSYYLVGLLESQQSIDAFSRGGWSSGVVAEWRLGESGQTLASTVTVNQYDVPAYIVSESGANVSSSAVLVNISRNEELTDSGLNKVTLPMKDTKARGTQQQHAPRKWDRILPFYGQRVIDLGYDLPLPIGISLIYVDTYQHMDIDELHVGAGGKGANVPIDFVAFSDNDNSSSTPQIKLDAWLFPFMNVFTSFGRISGDANVNFALNGDDLLNQLEIDCSGIINHPACGVLEGKETVPFNVNVDISGYSYSVGTVLAGGWRSYFLAVPLTFTYADMDRTNSDGIVFSAVPRAGKLFQFEDDRSLALYAGVSYLDSELRIDGNQPIPGTELSIDYKVRQENKDKWQGLVGGNFNVNAYWSVMFEYVGFGGDRRQVIAGLNRRF
ncbi:hypothetical protein ACVFI8_10805 [Agarivorans sp. MS3-6]|uniref:hypothetical protein n=1 Tax=Agarivorans sp. TSD2052 TaxID=2937286 RepID=UPI00200D8E4D|nr:hypothetical protein [Agarivorans sp. TSD2052]UPW18663.1 hypothetical protein M0C34_21015 [Agarivorans sp. TSD2052]